MDKKMFTQEQIEQLLKNENVTRCSEKAISYSKTFKVEAVKLYNEKGLTPREIFNQAGFDLKIIGKHKPKGCLGRWNKLFKIKGSGGLEIETRGKSKGGGRSKTKGLSDADKIKRLETEVAYLKAENDFLAKLRAKRRE